MPDNLRVATSLVSLSTTSGIQLAPKRHVSQTRSVLPCRSVQVSVVCCDCRLRLRVLQHLAKGSQMGLLDARDIDSTFSSTNTLFAQTVRVWIVSTRCSVKDSVFSQPVIHCAPIFSSFITVERHTPRNSNCMSAIASLTVSLRLFVNALTKPKRVSLRSATNRYSDPL